MRTRKINPFIVAYVVGLMGLAGLGYFYADYTIRAEQHDALSQRKQYSDVAYIDLPRMNLTLASIDGGHTGRVRIDVSLAVEKQYAMKLEGFQPIISDRLVSFTRKLDFDSISQPKAEAWLRQRLLQEVNTASFPVPVMDIIFRQLIVI